MSYRMVEPDDCDERPQPATCRECWVPCEDENDLCDLCEQRERDAEQRALARVQNAR